MPGLCPPSDFNSLGQIERLTLIDTQVMRRAADALVSEQVLASSEILCGVVDRGRRNTTSIVPL